MVTQLYSHGSFLKHIPPEGHPERPERLRAIKGALAGEAFSALVRMKAPVADIDVLNLAHSQQHISRVMDAAALNRLSQIDPDTWVSEGSLEAALRAVGSGFAAVDAVFSGEADNVFVACRPPGHHAERDRPMGFCLFNTAALTAIYAQQHYKADRIAIVDWDVHHGNGTQDIFWDDASVLFCSTHQMPLYPGSGTRDETGAGNIVNAPLAAGDGSAEFRDTFLDLFLPRLEAFSPDLIVISAGFDAHYLDPLGSLNLTEDDFDWATAQLMEIAGRHCSNRIVSVLEGGYDLKGLALSVKAHVNRLMKG